MHVCVYVNVQCSIDSIIVIINQFPIGLPSHPQHELAKRQCKGFSGMVTFVIKGDLETSKKFLKSLKVTNRTVPYQKLHTYILCELMFLTVSLLLV